VRVYILKNRYKNKKITALIKKSLFQRRRFEMSDKIIKCDCCTQDEKQKYDEIANVIDLYKDKEGSLIQILHLAQEIYGYLPLELQKFIAKALDKPLSEVSGVITFYSFFSTKPRGKHTIRVCLGTACYVRGGKKLVERLQDLLDIQIGETTRTVNLPLKSHAVSVPADLLRL
jgi:NADH:ubiquinone oxidoreductase subunit E